MISMRTENKLSPAFKFDESDFVAPTELMQLLAEISRDERVRRLEEAEAGSVMVSYKRGDTDWAQ